MLHEPKEEPAPRRRPADDEEPERRRWVGLLIAVGLAMGAAGIAALVLTGVLWAPLMLMLSDACTAAGVGQVNGGDKLEGFLEGNKVLDVEVK